MPKPALVRSPASVRGGEVTTYLDFSFVGKWTIVSVATPIFIPDPTDTLTLVFIVSF